MGVTWVCKGVLVTGFAAEVLWRTRTGLDCRELELSVAVRVVVAGLDAERFAPSTALPHKLGQRSWDRRYPPVRRGCRGADLQWPQVPERMAVGFRRAVCPVGELPGV